MFAAHHAEIKRDIYMQPIHKSEELLNLLQDQIVRENVCTDFEFIQFIREINKYSTGLEKNYLKALAYSLYNKIEQAIDFFELSLQFNNVDYARNYLAVINQRSSNKKYLKLLYRFADEYESVSFTLLAYQTSIYIANLKLAEHYLNKICKLSNKEKADKYKNNFERTKSALLKYCFLSGLNEDELMKLVSMAISILDNHQVKIVGVNYTNASVHNEESNIFIMTAECDDADILSEMNLQLAYELAEHKEFLGKNFSIFINGVDDVSKLKEGLTCL